MRRNRKKFTSWRIQQIFRHFVGNGSQRRHKHKHDRERSQTSPFPFRTFENCLPHLIAISLVRLIMSLHFNPHTGRPYSPAYYFMRDRAAELPASGRMPELLQTIRTNPVTIIVGETGSGKSTQVPKRILESMSDVINGDICLTQPRRLAAESVSLKTRCPLDFFTDRGSLKIFKHRSLSASPKEWKCG